MRLSPAQVQLRRYFEARGVPTMPDTANSYLLMCANLMDAAEETNDTNAHDADQFRAIWAIQRFCKHFNICATS